MTHRLTQRPILGLAATALATLLLTAGCGDQGTGKDTTAPAGSSGSPAAADTALGEGTWLLALSTAGGADAETSTTVYVSYDPSTGEATTRKMPPVQAASANNGDAALLISGNREWAIPDTATSREEERSGRLTVQSMAGTATKVLDVRALTGQADLKPVGWAFDPTKPDTLRVVGGDNTVWSLSVSGGKATREAPLAKGPWIFTDGFNKNTGVPYVESIDSDATKPAGNGPADTSPVQRADGTVLASGSEQLTALPPSPCRLGGGFTAADGTSWIFCAEKPTLSTYYLPKDAQKWEPYGKPSPAVVPDTASVPVVLPPAS